MAKSKIFIASSGRTLVLAEQLREQLRTDYCEAELWKEKSEGQPGDTIIEMLEGAAKEYDFAVIILSRDDVIVKETGDKLKARDNCIFEAGLFMAAIGRKRCFLVNSVNQGDLPSDLGGIIFLAFEEPQNLSDPTACKSAIMFASSRIKSTVYRIVYGQSASPIAGRLLSRESLLEKERLGDGGELFEGQVLVASIQPLELSYAGALQVRKNMGNNVRYFYFLPGDPDGAEKVSQLLQLVLLARVPGSREEGASFERCRERVANNLPQIMEDLKKLCRDQSINFCFLPAPPEFQYCIHNAADVNHAKLYVKHGEGFIEWESGNEAYQFWKDVRARQSMAEPEPPHAVFYGAPGFNLRENVFLRTLKVNVSKYFPGINEEVMKYCLEGHD